MKRPSSITIISALLGTLAVVPLCDIFAQKPSAPSLYRTQDVVQPGNWRAIPQGRVDRRSGIIRALYKIDYTPVIGDPEEIAKGYLRSTSTSLGLNHDLSDLRIASVKKSPLGYHVLFEQVYRDVPLYRSNTIVTIDRVSNKVVFLVNDHKPGIRLQRTSPQISGNDALTSAMRYLGAKGIERYRFTTRLMIHAEGDAPLLSYRVTFFAFDPFGDWEVFVDALTGRVFSVEDRIIYYDQPANKSDRNIILGSGLGWNPDPLTQTQSWYGTLGLVDPGGGCVVDSTTPQLDSQRVVLPLRDLTFSGGLYRLEGAYCRIMDWDSPSGPPATAVHPDSFRFNRQEQGFEDVLVYFFIDSSQRYIQSLGFSNIQNAPLVADAHGFQCQDNSFFSPSLNRLSFGEGGVDDAEDVDVILHEYGHAIHFGTDSSFFSGGESGAISEGFGDYWARSYGRAVSDWAWQRVFKWDAGTLSDSSGTFWAGRRCNDARPYPDGGVGGIGIHDAGQMWSTVLMEIWQDIGREVTDKCVLQSHYLLAGTARTMRDNAAAIIEADRSLYGGAHVQAMMNHFAARNFLYFVTLNRRSVTFGMYEVGHPSDTVTVSIKNYNQDTLDVWDISQPSPHFFLANVPSLPARLATFDTLAFGVVFVPQTAGTLFDSIAISTSDTSTPLIHVTISGTGFVITPAVRGTMYATTGVTAGSRLFVVDTSTAAATPIGPYGSGYTQIVSVRAHPQTHELLGLVTSGSNHLLVRINSAAGDAHWISTIPLVSLKGMAFRGDTLYVGRINGNLYRVDIGTGVASPVTTTNPLLNIAGLDFNPITGELWASVRAPSANPDRIYKIALPSGAATLVGSTGLGQTSDIIFDVNGRLFGITGVGTTTNNLIRIDTSNASAAVIGSMGIASAQALAMWPDSFITGVRDVASDGLPERSSLEQNFPNPFNPSTKIRFGLPARQTDVGLAGQAGVPGSRFVSLKIYNILGQEVATLVNEEMKPGGYEVTWDARGLASGLYFYRLTAGAYIETRKLVLLR